MARKADMKRVADVLMVVAAAPAWVPLAAAVALAVRIALGRPVFFLDQRAGLGGRPFRLVKFRTMREGPGDDASRLTAPLKVGLETSTCFPSCGTS